MTQENEYTYIDLGTGQISEAEYTYPGGKPIPDPSNLPGARKFLCFTTKSGDHVRLPYTGSQVFLLSKEFLDVVKTEHIPVPGFPGLTTQHKMIWVEIHYEHSKVKEEKWTSQ